jgi:hypothetical protein
MLLYFFQEKTKFSLDFSLSSSIEANNDESFTPYYDEGGKGCFIEATLNLT